MLYAISILETAKTLNEVTNFCCDRHTEINLDGAMETIDIILRMIYFCEDNWAIFVTACEERGYTEDEIGKAFDQLKEKTLKDITDSL